MVPVVQEDNVEYPDDEISGMKGVWKILNPNPAVELDGGTGDEVADEIPAVFQSERQHKRNEVVNDKTCMTNCGEKKSLSMTRRLYMTFFTSIIFSYPFSRSQYPDVSLDMSLEMIFALLWGKC
jgi:hypothetical protein